MTASRELSSDYHDAMDSARKAVEYLHRECFPLPRLVQRARTLYRAAWLAEQARQRIHVGS